MNSHITNLYPQPNGTVAGENLSCATSGTGAQFAAFGSDTAYVMIDVQDYNVYVTFDDTAPPPAMVISWLRITPLLP